jgi:hypothetical protein
MHRLLRTRQAVNPFDCRRRDPSLLLAQNNVRGGFGRFRQRALWSWNNSVRGLLVTSYATCASGIRLFVEIDNAGKIGDGLNVLQRGQSREDWRRITDLPMMTATCACGRVEVEAAGAPIACAVCYCDDCRKGADLIEALPGAGAMPMAARPISSFARTASRPVKAPIC